jgi:CHAT domain-containing protein/tetratricopeptide (TPR) repeat protein
MSNKRAATCVWAALLPSVVVALGGCSSQEAARPVLAAECRPINGSRPLEWRLASPISGTLRVAVEQRGITVVTTVTRTDTGRRSWALTGSSPIERFGLATFAPHVEKHQPISVSIRSRDSRDLTGEVCISADLLAPSDARRLRAEQSFAAAAQATQAEDWQRAFDLYRNAARDFDGIDELRTAQAHHAMSWLAYWNLRDDEGASVLAAWARADFGAQAEPGLHSTLLTLQAYSLLESQRFAAEERRERVLELLKRAETYARRSRFGERELPRFDILRGFMDFRTGHTSEASELFVHAAAECERLRDWECAARARQNVAAMAEEARDYPVALQAYRRALDALPSDLNPKLSADIWGNFGRLQTTVGLFRQAEQSHRTSIRLHADLADCDGTRMALSRLGTLLVQVGSVDEGGLYLKHAASSDCPSLMSMAKRESGVEAGGPGDFGAVARNAPVCVDLPEPDTLSEAGKIAVFNALLGLHDASRLENDLAQAERCLDGARDYAGTARTKLRLANAEGATLLERGAPAKAGAAFERGLAIADRAQLSATHENRSVAYLGLARAALLENHPAKARDFATHALRLGATRGDLRQVTDALQWMARSFSAEQSPDQAASILNVAMALIEQVPIDDLDAEQRATWLATQHAVFAELTTLLASQSRNDEDRAWLAFQVSERGRARSLRYAMSQATDTRATTQSEPASVRYRELLRRIVELARDAPETDPRAPNSRVISLASLAELVGQQAQVTDSAMVDALRRRLAALDATVVEYSAGADDMIAFVIDSDHIRVVTLGSRRDIATAAAGLYDRVHNPESALGDVRNAARRVAELALWPLTDLLVRRRVIFIPDDALHTVPFAVLPWSHGKDAPLVVQQTELSVMPSTLFVTRTAMKHAGHDSSPRLELIGDPVFRAVDWQRECHDGGNSPSVLAASTSPALERSAMSSLPRLPGSRQEVAAIAELAHQYSPSSRVREHLGCAATPRALREAAASSPTLLHIATHGYVDAYRPRLSALALTPDVDSSGTTATFGLLEILQMKISSRLVVLSACDTSRGRLLPGEGVLGPAQAFLQAGADSVLASYWRIEDRATAPFMRSFYKYLLVEHLSAAAALRRTQLDYVRQGGPYDWAAFTLFGQPDTEL